MSSYKTDNVRIAKNTSLLYIRMILAMIMSLYTSRLLLQNLGEVDFGVYNVIGGFVALFAFVNGAMVSSTRRYITFALGLKDYIEVKKVFSVCFYIHVFLGIIISLITLFAGSWFIEYKMQIPPDRIDTAYIILYYSVISIFVLCITVPHNALVVAHEKMGTFAILSIIEVFLKFLIALYLGYTTSNRLRVYAFLILLVSILVRFMYVFYCHFRFNNMSYSMSKDWNMYKSMIAFAGWNSLSALSSSSYQYGTSLLMNVFFGPILNTARAIAIQVQGLVNSFVDNFQQAMNPQITKSFSSGDNERFEDLIFFSSRLSFFLLMVIVYPLFIELEQVVKLWLGTYPDYTIAFIRFSFIISMFDCITNSLTVAVQSVGRVRNYQFFSGLIQLSILPISYVVLKIGFSPISVYVVNTFIIILLLAFKMYSACRLIKVKKSIFYRTVIIPMVKIILLSLLAYFLLSYIIEDVYYIFKILVYFIVVCLLVFLCGLKRVERSFILDLISTKLIKNR